MINNGLHYLSSIYNLGLFDTIRCGLLATNIYKKHKYYNYFQSLLKANGVYPMGECGFADLRRKKSTKAFAKPIVMRSFRPLSGTTEILDEKLTCIGSS